MITLRMNTLETVLDNLPAYPKARAALDAQLAYFVPGYETDVRYLTRSWDGKEHLLKYTNEKQWVIPTGLVTRTQQILRALKIDHSLVNDAPEWRRDPNLADFQEARLSLRPYQVSAVMAVLSAKPRAGGVIQIATGGGKTRCAAKLCQLMQVRTVFLVNQKDLMYQTIREFEQMLGVPVGQVGDGKVDIQPVTVATLQSVSRAAGDATTDSESVSPEHLAVIREMMLNASLIILDECHSAPSRTARTAICSASNATMIVGLSASPWRDDGTDILIEAICGPVVYRLSASDLIEKGFLVAPAILVHQLPEPERLTADHSADRFDRLYRAWIVNNKFRQDYTVLLCERHIKNGDITIVLVKQIEHGETLSNQIPASVFLNGKLGKRRRSEILAGVTAGEIKVLIATSLADQGLDIPIANVLILAGAGKSSTKALQRIGRVLRPAPGKTGATVHDLVDAAPVFRRHYRERVQMYASEPRFSVKHVKPKQTDIAAG